MSTSTAQIAFRYHAQDSATGVTRTTAKRLADVLGVDEAQVIHLNHEFVGYGCARVLFNPGNSAASGSRIPAARFPAA